MKWVQIPLADMQRAGRIQNNGTKSKEREENREKIQVVVENTSSSGETV